MIDRVEAKKNLQRLEDDQYHLVHLHHLNCRESFKHDCQKRMCEIKEQIASIRVQLRQH